MVMREKERERERERERGNLCVFSATVFMFHAILGCRHGNNEIFNEIQW